MCHNPLFQSSHNHRGTGPPSPFYIRQQKHSEKGWGEEKDKKNVEVSKYRLWDEMIR